MVAALNAGWIAKWLRSEEGGKRQQIYDSRNSRDWEKGIHPTSWRWKKGKRNTRWGERKEMGGKGYPWARDTENGGRRCRVRSTEERRKEVGRKKCSSFVGGKKRNSNYIPSDINRLPRAICSAGRWATELVNQCGGKVMLACCSSVQIFLVQLANVHINLNSQARCSWQDLLIHNFATSCTTLSCADPEQSITFASHTSQTMLL